jgi:uncharacterized protein YecA (UPF0149 family)
MNPILSTQNKIDSNAEQYFQYFRSFLSFKKGTPLHRKSPKIGRNDPCPCKSGKKYKRCCLEKDLNKS